MPAAAGDPLIGRVLSDRYRVIEKIGEGGVGTVYAAEYVETGRRVALKVLLPELAGEGSAAAQSFIDEARTVARLGHENLIDVYFAGRSAEGLVYLAMEYLEGNDLGAIIRGGGALDWRRARPILLQVTRALAAVHRAGVVHSDIKPDNIFLVARGADTDFVKLLDFGIAKLLGALPPEEGRVSGTPQFMAPEQALGRGVDARTDVYGLGCVMYQMTTGELAFDGASPIDVLASQVADAPVPPRVRRPDLAIVPGVERIILRALEKDPQSRFPSMDEMHEALERIRFTTGGAATVSGAFVRIDDPRPRRLARRRQVRAWTVAVSLACVVTAGLLVMLRPRVPAQIQVTLEPGEGELYVDDVRVGVGAAHAVEAAAGRHTLSARAPGYLPAAEVVRLGEGEWREVRMALRPSPTTGFDLSSQPPDLPVWLDGEPLLIGEGGDQVRTGRPARHVVPGAHVVEVRSGETVWLQAVLVEPDRLLRVHAVVVPPAKPAAKRTRHRIRYR